MQQERDAAVRQVVELQRLNDQILHTTPGEGGGGTAQPPEAHTLPSRRHSPGAGGGGGDGGGGGGGGRRRSRFGRVGASCRLVGRQRRSLRIVGGDGPRVPAYVQEAVGAEEERPKVETASRSLRLHAAHGFAQPARWHMKEVQPRLSAFV